MPGYRKLGRPSDQRRAILRNQVTALIWNGKIITTDARAKEIRSIAEKLITLAVNEHNNTTTVTKNIKNDKGVSTDVKLQNDLPSKLAARRRIMAYLYDVPEPKKKGESKGDYIDRTKDVKHPVVEKLFREIAPKYDKRRTEKGTGGGYTRIVRIGPRRGDAAEMVVLELI
jgi:large subunit ribosomal protein L17